MEKFIIRPYDIDTSAIDFHIAGYDKHVVLHVVIVPQGRLYLFLIVHDYSEMISINSDLDKYGIEHFNIVQSVNDFSVKGAFERYRSYYQKKYNSYVSATPYDKEPF